MTTPEGKVKAKVKKLLDEAGAYYFMPSIHGYGSSGVPDIIALLHGRFIGIECKANTGLLTKLQEKNLSEIREHGGIGLVVDETGIELFKLFLGNVMGSSVCDVYDMRGEQS